LNIAGRNLPLNGFVPDIINLYSKSQVVVAPIYHGAGTNIKVLEAMKMKKATVISSFAARGFIGFLQDYENILIAQNDVDFSQKVVLALNDKKLNKIMGRNASTTVNKHFSLNIFKNTIQEVVD
jgi:glycosyltransferase involved in cell wall biosynthesis